MGLRKIIENHPVKTALLASLLFWGGCFMADYKFREREINMPKYNDRGNVCVIENYKPSQ